MVGFLVHPLITAGGHHAEHPDVVLKGDAMASRGDMPHPHYVFSHNPDHGSLFPVAKKKLAGKPQRFEEQKKGLIAPMKDLKIMADDLNVPTQGGRVISEAYRQSGVYVGQASRFCKRCRISSAGSMSSACARGIYTNWPNSKIFGGH
jgi:hypothetical protein